MQSQRLKRVEEQVRKDVAEILRQMAQNQFRGLIISVTAVRISPDLSVARISVSLFPTEGSEELLTWLNEREGQIKNQLVQRMSGQLRKMPELHFYLDESLERKEEIERILREGGESPIR